MTDPTRPALDEIEARANAATEGPWRLCDDYSDVLNPDGYQLASYAATADGEFIAAARTDVSALLAEVRRLQSELAEYEVLSPQQCPKGVHADWLIDSEYGHACPWCQIDDLKAGLADARADAIEHAAAVVDEKLTAEPDHNRASALYELLLNLRGELPCTCARSWGLHAKGCGKYVPGHELISRHNALAAYRAERSPAVSAAGESGSTR